MFYNNQGRLNMHRVTSTCTVGISHELTFSKLVNEQPGNGHIPQLQFEISP